MTVFTEISVVSDGEAAEAIAEVLRPFAYQEGVVLEQLGAADDAHADALDPAITVKIYVPQDQDTAELRRRIEEILYHLNRLYPVPPPAYKALAETDWANAWKEHYHPFRIGDRIWIQPSWVDEIEPDDDPNQSPQPDDITLVLDPGMAFGTGLHPTTQSCLRALEDTVQTGDRVLDVGTGSGILSIAALKMGAAYATAIDTDELAVKTALANAAQNNVSSRIDAWQGELSSVGEFSWDVVCVNILAPVIIMLLQDAGLMDYVAGSGSLILSGIIDTQSADVEAAVLAAGGVVANKIVVRDWITLLVRPD